MGSEDADSICSSSKSWVLKTVIRTCYGAALGRGGVGSEIVKL